MAKVGDLVELLQNGSVTGYGIILSEGDGVVTVAPVLTAPGVTVPVRAEQINDDLFYVNGTIVEVTQEEV